jgi:hypothetical protein
MLLGPLPQAGEGLVTSKGGISVRFRMDTGTTGQTIEGNSAMATVGAVHGAEDTGG